MTFRDLLLVSCGTILAAAGIITNLIWNENFSTIPLFLLGLLILLVVVLQRRSHARLHERVLYLISAERERQKDLIEITRKKSSAGLDQVTAKKIIGLLHAQQMSMERLKTEILSEPGSRR